MEQHVAEFPQRKTKPGDCKDNHEFIHQLHVTSVNSHLKLCYSMYVNGRSTKNSYVSFCNAATKTAKSSCFKSLMSFSSGSPPSVRDRSILKYEKIYVLIQKRTT